MTGFKVTAYLYHSIPYLVVNTYKGYINVPLMPTSQLVGMMPFSAEVVTEDYYRQHPKEVQSSAGYTIVTLEGDEGDRPNYKGGPYVLWLVSNTSRVTGPLPENYLIADFSHVTLLRGLLNERLQGFSHHHKDTHDPPVNLLFLYLFLNIPPFLSLIIMIYLWKTLMFDHDTANSYVYRDELYGNEKERALYCQSECLICIQDFSLNSQIRVLSCNHYFHKSCIHRWLERSGNCPICREPVAPGYLVRDIYQQSLPLY